MAASSFRDLLVLGLIRPEVATQSEVDALVRVGRTRLADAADSVLAPENRSALARGAARTFGLAALRWHWYRPTTRFQATGLTLGLGVSRYSASDPTRGTPNLATEQGALDDRDTSLGKLLHIAQVMAERVAALGSLPSA